MGRRVKTATDSRMDLTGPQASSQRLLWPSQHRDLNPLEHTFTSLYNSPVGMTVAPRVFPRKAQGPQPFGRGSFRVAAELVNWFSSLGVVCQWAAPAWPGPGQEGCYKP